ncbi:ATP-binding protein [Aquabacterium sp.]|uniref:ATP-binding protein n=1 Tax=Aquabacterium sp. TaxID=1872578 RepID=UPI0019A4FB25|nr:ATP-binding protein [Aquabacterium sp.]MBC7699186.1 response regulator [Aquabacterium sp.]
MKQPEPPGELRRDRFLSLIERKTALGFYLIAAVACMLVWGSELMAGISTPHDRWAQPVLALLLLWMWAMLRRNPHSLMFTQQVVVAGVSLYFVVGTLSVLIFNQQPASPYWIATNFQWMPVVALLMHIAWPWRWAVGLSIALLALVAIPAWVLEVGTQDQVWSGVVRSLVVNGALMQITFLVSLLSVTRLKHGVSLVVAGDPHGPTDARDALNAWVQERTSELAQARDTAETASLAKSRFLAVMSHELRTPLHAMLVSADLLADHPERARDPRDALLIQTIHSSGQHLLTLIDQVLELSRIESGKVEPLLAPLDLSAIADKALAAVSPQATVKGLELRRHVSPSLALSRMGDELRLTQVLINLLANAIKFTDRGHVSLSMGPSLAKALDGVAGVRLSVSDTGQGMSQSEQSRVFEAFFQADTNSTRTNGGVGLGLTITQELVALMQGTITVNSRERQGTRIDIDLPLAVLADDARAPARRVLGRPDLKGTEVLVVDDDPVNSMLAAEVLRAAGATVFTADTGPAALAFLRQHTPNVVLMDWRMPGMDGLEATRRVRMGEAGVASLDVPVLGLTANAFSEDRSACLNAGMNHVLTKPVDRQLLLEEVGYWATQSA